MKVFVAGATGAVGRLLLPKLVDAGHEVIGMTRSSEKAGLIESTQSRAVVVDVYDGDGLKTVINGIRPDVVIHQLTALHDRDFAENNRVRIEGTRNLIDACHAAGVSRVIAQSLAWAYKSGEGPAVEDEALDTQTDDASRKRLVNGVAALEDTVSEVSQHVILRYGKLYGPGTWYDKDELISLQALQGQLSATLGIESFVHVEDAAQAALEAIEWPGGLVNIVDDEPAKGSDWVPVYAHALGAPEPEVQHVREDWERGASNTLARRQYGWQMKYSTWRTGFETSLK